MERRFSESRILQHVEDSNWRQYISGQPKLLSPEEENKTSSVRSSPLDAFYKKGVLWQGFPATLLQKSLWHRCFAVNFAKLLKTPFLTEHLWWLLLSITNYVLYHKVLNVNKRDLVRVTFDASANVNKTCCLVK